jgi:hypothetical protein
MRFAIVAAIAISLLSVAACTINPPAPTSPTPVIVTPAPTSAPATIVVPRTY